MNTKTILKRVMKKYNISELEARKLLLYLNDITARYYFK